MRLQPNPDFNAEELTAYELGYRVRTIPSLYVTASLFFNDLENTLSVLECRARSPARASRVILERCIG